LDDVEVRWLTRYALDRAALLRFDGLHGQAIEFLPLDTAASA